MLNLDIFSVTKQTRQLVVEGFLCGVGLPIYIMNFFTNQLINRLITFWQLIRRLQSYSNFLWVYAGEFNQIIFYEIRNCDDM